MVSCSFGSNTACEHSENAHNVSECVDGCCTMSSGDWKESHNFNQTSLHLANEQEDDADAPTSPVSSSCESPQSEHEELTKHTLHMVRLYNLHSGKEWKEEHEQRLYTYCTSSEVDLLRAFIVEFTQSHILPLAKRIKKDMRSKVFQQRSTQLISKWRVCYESKASRRKDKVVKARRASVNFSAEAQVRFINHRLDEPEACELDRDEPSECIMQ